MESTIRNIEKIKQQMILASSSHNLPIAYPDDLELDIQQIERYLNISSGAVWLLRSYGTVLVPAGVGVDPSYITNWLYGNSGQKIIAFHITSEGVCPVSYEEAEKIINRPPATLSSFDSLEKIRKTVDHVLQLGCEMRLWGMWEAAKYTDFDTLSKWQQYFSDNTVMDAFIRKANQLATAYQAR